MSRVIAGLDAVLAFPLLAVLVLYLAAVARQPEPPRPRPQLAMCPTDGAIAMESGQSIRIFGVCREVERDREWRI